jgi:hypothetical protein
MKTTLTTFLILYLLNIQLSFAQDSIAISETGTWINQCFSTDGEYWKMYLADGDTTINNIQYVKLNSYSLQRIGANAFSIISPKEHILSYRNDNSDRAFAILANSSSEKLWYDYNLSIGDSLIHYDYPHPLSYENINGTVLGEEIITSIDSVDFCGNTYSQFHFNNDSLHASLPKLIKKVGFDGDLISKNDVWFENDVYLFYFCETPLNIQNNIIYAGTEDLSMEQTLSVYPNPAKDLLNINFPTQTKETDILSIKDMTGKEVYRTFKFNVENNQINFNLIAGSYLVEYISDENYYRSKLIINQ